MTKQSVTQTTEKAAVMTYRVASVPCGPGDAFMHPACCGDDLRRSWTLHDLTVAELFEQQILYCDGCGERIAPKPTAEEVGAR